ncbi:MAG: hypothetical protein HN909_03600 [Phycisphaerales bacterium]|jgi:hypothetical protein|nr:hypothetical protein [Phycisphaerales bacterium]MBT7170837.1 hypothetical protein [Phycisphaerales bacterium]
MIQFMCPHCGEIYRLPDSQAGKAAQCACSKKLLVPPPLEDAPAAAAPAVVTPVAPAPPPVAEAHAPEVSLGSLADKMGAPVELDLSLSSLAEEIAAPVELDSSLGELHQAIETREDSEPVSQSFSLGAVFAVLAILSVILGGYYVYQTNQTIPREDLKLSETVVKAPAKSERDLASLLPPVPPRPKSSAGRMSAEELLNNLPAGRSSVFDFTNTPRPKPAPAPKPVPVPEAPSSMVPDTKPEPEPAPEPDPVPAPTLTLGKKPAVGGKGLFDYPEDTKPAPATKKQSTPAPYKIIDSKTFNTSKRSLSVRLSRKVSKKALRDIALTLKSQDPNDYERTLIVYYLPEMEIKSGAWATTHFDSKLEVKILGLTIEEETKLLNEPLPTDRTVIGRWIDESPYVSGRITMYSKEAKFFIETKFKDGSVLQRELVETKSVKGRRFEKEEGSAVGDFYLLDSEGNLQMWDNTGLIVTLKKS